MCSVMKNIYCLIFERVILIPSVKVHNESVLILRILAFPKEDMQ